MIGAPLKGSIGFYNKRPKTRHLFVRHALWSGSQRGGPRALARSAASMPKWFKPVTITRLGDSLVMGARLLNYLGFGRLLRN